MYKVKNLNDKSSQVLQKEIENWIESREKIEILSVNIWNDSGRSYGTIVYREVRYVG